MLEFAILLQVFNKKKNAFYLVDHWFGGDGGSR